jgi:hypothetical protein
MRPVSFGWLTTCALVVLMLPACGGSGDDAADAPLAPATTAVATTTTAAPVTTTAAPVTTTVAEDVVMLPGSGEPWDLLFFGQEDILTRQLPEEYAALASNELSVEVRPIQPPGFDYVWAAIMLPRLQGAAYPPLDHYVPPAEIIVLFSRPGETPDGSEANIVEDFERCWKRATQGEPPTTNLPADYWDSYRRNLDDIYSELWALRQDTPTVLLTIDVYNPSLPQQRQGGIEAECTAWFESWSQQSSEAAADNGSTFVSLYDLFNGPNHDQDPAEAAYIGPTDDEPGAHWYQATPTGVDLIAQRLADAGYEPTSQP